MKQNGIFIITALLTVVFWQWAYLGFKSHFSGMHELKDQVAALTTEVERTQVRKEVVQYQFDLFKQQVARVIPEFNFEGRSEIGKERRGLASVLQVPNEDFLILSQFDATIDELRTLFEKGSYKQVIRKAKNILLLNPVSPDLVTVYFMLAESYYQTNEMEACLEVAQQMTQLLPEEQKTGYVLLRVGLLLKEKNRLEEARNMFGLVAHAFAAEKELKDQSERLFASVGGGE